MSRDTNGRGLGFVVGEHRGKKWLRGWWEAVPTCSGPGPFLPGGEPGTVVPSKGPPTEKVSATPTSWRGGRHHPGGGRPSVSQTGPSTRRPPQHDGSTAGGAPGPGHGAGLPAPAWHELPPVPPVLARSCHPLRSQRLGECQQRPGGELGQNQPHCYHGSRPQGHRPSSVANGDNGAPVSGAGRACVTGSGAVRATLLLLLMITGTMRVSSRAHCPPALPGPP